MLCIPVVTGIRIILLKAFLCRTKNAQVLACDSFSSLSSTCFSSVSLFSLVPEASASSADSVAAAGAPPGESLCDEVEFPPLAGTS